MNGIAPQNDIRKMEDGGWYWVSKPVIQEYAPKVGFLSACVYHLLASMADENQSCYPSQRYIAEKLGCCRSSVSRAVRKLKDQGLIRSNGKGRDHSVYQLLKVRSCTSAIQVSHRCNSDDAPVDTNNTSLTRNNNNNVVSVKKINRRTDSNEEFKPQTKEELLALEIAQTLGDPRNPRKYLQYTKRYAESLLREVLSQVKQTPEEKIKKSRVALFVYLVNHYAKRSA
ncbi:MAG TPA: helix-turn-helix domain-containing protein [Bacteroidota bacterium]|nr:helix-turn-helix domain-containing protein [Bacteroidota bacterium]